MRSKAKIHVATQILKSDVVRYLEERWLTTLQCFVDSARYPKSYDLDSIRFMLQPDSTVYDQPSVIIRFEEQSKRRLESDGVWIDTTTTLNLNWFGRQYGTLDDVETFNAFLLEIKNFLVTLEPLEVERQLEIPVGNIENSGVDPKTLRKVKNELIRINKESGNITHLKVSDADKFTRETKIPTGDYYVTLGTKVYKVRSFTTTQLCVTGIA